MSRRSPGEGCITQRKNGRWQGSLQVGSTRKTVYGKTRSEVAEKLHKLQDVARRSGAFPSGDRITVGNYLAQWLEQAESRLRPTTLDAYQVIANHCLVPRIGNLKLAKLDPLRISRLYSHLAKEGHSKRRVQSVHQFLHKTLSDAYRWGVIPSNPTAIVDAPTRDPREHHLWNPEQIDTFLAAMAQGVGGSYGNLFAFLLASGCRLGEALGLRWTHVDWGKGAVRIDKGVTTVRGNPVEGPPKTKAGVRTIGLPRWGLEALHRQKAQAKGVRVFTTDVGTTPDRRNVLRAFHAICEKLELPKVRVHDLRHISLSLLAMSGVPLKVAQQRAGHSSASVTLNIYQHVLGDGDKLAAEALDRVMGGGVP